MTARAAVAAAERGARAWRSVVVTQGSTVPDKPELHVLAGQLVDTLQALELVAGVLLRQVHGFGDELQLCDHDGRVPTARLVTVAGLLADLRSALGHAERAASGFCTQVDPVSIEVA